MAWLARWRWKSHGSWHASTFWWTFAFWLAWIFSNRGSLAFSGCLILCGLALAEWVSD